MHTSDIKQAASLLKAGKLVAIPTETVYGLGADARNDEAITKVFLAKERPFTHPLIVHLANSGQVQAWVKEIPDEAYLLAKAFWPGPLTLILKKENAVSNLLTGNQDTVGIRIPAHPKALAILKAFGGGIAAPSANRYSRISPTTKNAVLEELGDKVDFIVEGGACTVGIESTILDLSRSHPSILRPGMITAEQIEKVLGQKIPISQESAPRVSGMDILHYAPETKLKLIDPTQMHHFLNQQTLADFPLAILTHKKYEHKEPRIQWIFMDSNPAIYAREIYATLRELDKRGFKQIIVEALPEDSKWDALRDRLGKAAGTR